MALPTEQDLEQCMCRHCPSYVEGGGQLFCVHGEAGDSRAERGCFCRTCPVHVTYHLKNRAFCLRGKAEE